METAATRDFDEEKDKDDCNSDPWDALVRPRFEEILNELKPSLLLTKLYSQRLITRDEFKQLRTSSMSEEEQSLSLLVEILPDKQPRIGTFETFLSILRSVPKQQHIATLLEPSNSESTQQTLQSSVQPVPTATRVSSNPRESDHTPAAHRTTSPATATAANTAAPMPPNDPHDVQQRIHASHNPSVSKPMSATSSKKEIHPSTSSATRKHDSSSMFDEFYRLLVDKRDLVAQHLELRIDKVLANYQLDDCAGNVGRLSDDKVAPIKHLSDNKSKAEAFLDVIVEGGVDSAKRLSYTLLGVQPEILDLLSPQIRKQIEAETSINIRQAMDGAISNLSSQKRKLVIVVVGKTGVGKSTLVNCILGKHVAESGYGRPVTSTPKPYTREIRGIDVKVWDTPGFRDHPGSEGDEVDRKYLTAMAKGIKEIDLLIFCLQADSRKREDDGISIRILTLAFGKEIWERGMIALTKSNTIEDASGQVPDDKFLKQAIKSLTRHCREHLRQEAKLGGRNAHDVPCVPTGSMKHQILKDGTEWLPEFWVTALERMPETGATFLIHLNRDRLRLHGSDKHFERDGNGVVSTTSESGSGSDYRPCGRRQATSSGINSVSGSTYQTNYRVSNVSVHNEYRAEDTAKDKQYDTPITLNETQAERVKKVEEKSVRSVLGSIVVAAGTALAVGATGGAALAAGAAAGVVTSLWNYFTS